MMRVFDCKANQGHTDTGTTATDTEEITMDNTDGADFGSIFSELMGKGRVEPSAEARQGAAGIRQLYLAFTGEGFTDAQALALVIGMLQGANNV